MENDPENHIGPQSDESKLADISKNDEFTQLEEIPNLEEVTNSEELPELAKIKAGIFENNEIPSKELDIEKFPEIGDERTEETCTVIEMMDGKKYSDLKNVVFDILRAKPGLTEKQMWVATKIISWRTIYLIDCIDRKENCLADYRGCL